MIISVSQILIFVCVIIFIVFNLIAVYLYQENYNYVKIKVRQPLIAWSVLSDVELYDTWWRKFKNVESPKSNVSIVESHTNAIFKIIVNGLSKNFHEESWTFIIKEDKTDGTSVISVKKQTLTSNKFDNFANKYIKNKKDIKRFVADFIREYNDAQDEADSEYAESNSSNTDSTLA